MSLLSVNLNVMEPQADGSGGAALNPLLSAVCKTQSPDRKRLFWMIVSNLRPDRVYMAFSEQITCGSETETTGLGFLGRFSQRSLPYDSFPLVLSGNLRWNSSRETGLSVLHHSEITPWLNRWHLSPKAFLITSLKTN